jgi:hypothetical protein
MVCSWTSCGRQQVKAKGLWCNAVAHRFAKDCYHNKFCKSWVFVPLGYVVNALPLIVQVININALASHCAGD